MVRPNVLRKSRIKYLCFLYNSLCEDALHCLEFFFETFPRNLSLESFLTLKTFNENPKKTLNFCLEIALEAFSKIFQGAVLTSSNCMNISLNA